MNSVPVSGGGLPTIFVFALLDQFSLEKVKHFSMSPFLRDFIQISSTELFLTFYPALH